MSSPTGTPDVSTLVSQLEKKGYAVLDAPTQAAPFAELKGLTTKLMNDEKLVEAVNAETPGGKWPNIKTAALHQLGHENVDLKVPFDMSPQRYEELGEEMVFSKTECVVLV